MAIFWQFEMSIPCQMKTNTTKENVTNIEYIMKLKDLLRTESTVHEQYLAHNSNRIIEMFADAIKDENRCPHTVIIELNHLLSKNDEEWKKM